MPMPWHVPLDASGERPTPCIALRPRVQQDSAMIETDPFASYDAGPYFCELTAREGDAGTIARIRDRVCAIGLDALRTRAAGAEHDLINLGITFTVYSEAEAIDRILPFDCVPAHHHRRRMALLERRGEAAGEGAELLPARHLPRSRTSATASSRPRWCSATRTTGRRWRGFPVRFGTYVHICGIDIVRDQPRHVLRAGGQCPHAVRRVLRDRKPPPDAAHLPGPDGRHDAAAGGRLRPPPAQAAMDEIAPEGVDGPAGRAAVAGHLQLGVFRARVPGARDGRAAGGGAGPAGGERPRVHAHHRRAAPGAHHLPPHRRRLPGPDGVPRRQPAGRARADRRLAPPAT